MPKDKSDAPVGFAEIATAARDDAKANPADAPHLRYLSAAHITDAEERAKLFAVVSYQVNSMSREAEIVPPRKVNEWLWTVNLDDYGWKAQTWEDLKRVNAYFTIKVQAASPAKAVKKTRQVQRLDQYGRPYYATEEYEEQPAAVAKEDFVPAPWLPAKEMTELVLLTGSVTPVVAADQFLDQTMIQSGRGGHGYYDFLQLDKTKTVKDLDDLIGFDRAKAVKARREVAAIVLKSGVAKFPRQIFREAAVTGGRWETRDTDSPLGDGNAVDRLFEAFKPKAKEIIVELPNGLPGYYLADAADKRQDAAPTAIVGNHKSFDNDLEIHAGTLTCVVCHRGALIKPRDYGRAVYSDKTGVGLAVIDPDLKRRANYAYLTKDFARALEEDNLRFDRKYKEATGLDTKDLIPAIGDVWKAYHVESVSLKRAAARAGVKPEVLRDALRKHVSAKQKAGVPADAVLANFLLDDEDAQPVPVDLFEERFPVLMLILGGANP